MARKAPVPLSHPGDREITRTITLEEHYASPAFLDGPGQRLKDQPRMTGRIGSGSMAEDLLDLGEKRIAEMDAAGIDVQVLSLTDPSVQQLDAAGAVKLAREANDYLAEAVRRYPRRFAGFATLPTAAPDIAADELERMVKEHGFKGGWINGHTRGCYLDDKFFWPILERADALKVPLCIHPTPPPAPVIEAYYSGFSPEVVNGFSRHGWGWHIETAVHVLRLILGGAFDQFPDLQIVIGHMGEALPFMMPRLDKGLSTNVTKLEHPVADYLRENVYYSFSGFNFIQTFLNLYLQVGADRILFSADYPYSSMAEARTFLENLPVSRADKNRIAHGNAERLLRL
ncbi:MAG: amidohydrolase family protein [Methanoregula sp.]|uniref:amidohydrolase family protein n=2 Tax=Methanoregula sp. TaxID=2052170 RepID=UPI003BAFDC64